MRRLFVSIVLLAAGAYAVSGHAQGLIGRRQAVATDADFRGLNVVSATTVWASGTKGTYARTVDGGATWTTGVVPEAESLDFRDVEAFGDQTAYLLAAGPGEASRIYKTVDGGKTWAMQWKNAEPKGFFDAIAFWDGSHGIALGDPINGAFQLLTTNDGNSWKPLVPKTLPAALVGESAFAASGTCLVTDGERDVWFATGGAKVARVVRSKDRGQTWEAFETPLAAGVESAGVFSIAFRDKDHGMIVGGDYKKPNEKGVTAALTKDGGATWTALPDRLPYRSAVAWSNGRWIAVGPTGADESSDDGMTWKSIDRESYSSVRFAPTGEGWAVGPKGRIARLTTR